MTALVYGLKPPARLPDAWEPCSMDTASAVPVLRRYHVPHDWPEPVRVVIWSGIDDKVRHLAAEWDDGRRCDIRLSPRGSKTSLTRAVAA